VDDYLAYVRETGLSDYSSTPGNVGALVLCSREDSEVAELLVISLWKDLAAIEAFAGSDIRRAIYYPADEDYLIDPAPTVDHLDVAMLEGPWPGGEV
jgi:heme-degrading monooxygenase HmoA